MMTTFNKKPLDYEEQLNILESRGLNVTNRDFALHCLRHLNYYRLSAYRFPLTKHGNPDQFLHGVDFEDIWKLYEFDQTLRRLVLDGAKRVEVSIRSQWAYTLGHKYGPFCYEDSSIFTDKALHLRGLAKVYNDLASSKEDFIQHFQIKYGLTRPPIWAICEVLSLGQLSRFFQNLKDPSVRKEIALVYSLDEKILTSYLRHLTVVRNIAAHHSRLWNRRFSDKFTLPKRPESLNSNFVQDPIASKKNYNTLTLLIFLLNQIDPKCTVTPFLVKSIDILDSKFHSHMGFPEDWKDRAIWRPYL